MKTTDTKATKEVTLEDQIAGWKVEHKKIFKNTIDGKDYIWRRIKRSEYSEIMGMKDGADVDERIYNRQYAIAKKVILNISEAELEADLDELAGLATTIADEVLDKSGFNATTTIEL